MDLSGVTCRYGGGSKGIPARTLNNGLIPRAPRVGAGVVWREEGTLASPSLEGNPKSLASGRGGGGGGGGCLQPPPLGENLNPPRWTEARVRGGKAPSSPPPRARALAPPPITP